MKIHHLNCGTMRPFGTRPLNGTGSGLRRGSAVLHCLLIDTGDGLVLVDAGWGLADYTHPTPLVDIFLRILGTPRDINELAINQVQRLGYQPTDVTDIIMTHCHLDHAGGLPDFPHARVHLYRQEMNGILHPRDLNERLAIRPEHTSHDVNWVVHDLESDSWFGFDCTPPITVGDTTFHLIPLPGHTRGHCMVAIQLGPDNWLLHCGDGYGYYGWVDPDDPHLPPGGNFARVLFSLIKITRPLYNYAPRLRTLFREHGHQIRHFCSHDPHEYAAFTTPT